MLIIEITNAQELVRQRVGRLAQKLISAITDEEAQVEKAIIEEIEQSFRDYGVKANIYSISGLDMLGNGRIEVPVTVHESKFMS
jgi:hypothetical protein